MSKVPEASRRPGPDRATVEPSKREAIDVVRTFLAKNGYPLEFAAGRTLARVGFRTWHGLTYVDNEVPPGKTREYDILAALHGATASDVGLVVECKSTADPWLVLTHRISGDGRWVRKAWLPSNSAGVPDSAFEDVGWRLDARYGFNVVRAVGERRSESDKDPAYSALASVTKAAEGRVRTFPNSSPALMVPVIVTSGPLFRLGYEDDGSELLEPVLWHRILWSGSSVRDDATIVDVVTEAHLESYGRMMHAALTRVAAVSAARPQTTSGFA